MIKKYRIQFLIVCVVVIAIVGIAVTTSSVSEAKMKAKIDACESSVPQREQCLNDLITSVTEREGVSAGFDVLAAVYERNETFAKYCHGATHEIGIVAYETYARGDHVDLSEKTSYCGFGFYHGFLEALLHEDGELSEARKFCEYADEQLRIRFQGTPFACYHGIGHGVVDGTDPSRWGNASLFIEPGLIQCEALGEIEEHKERCASGVFNALAIAYMDPKYRMTVAVEDAYDLCTEQSARYAREACYDQMNGYVIHRSPTFKDALAVAAKTEPLYTPTAVRSVAAFAARKALAKGDFSTYFAACDSTSSHLRDICTEGFSDGLVEFGKPNEEYKIAIAACVGSNRKEACLRGVVGAVKQRFSPSVQEETCSAIDKLVGVAEGEVCWSAIRAPASSSI